MFRVLLVVHRMFHGRRTVLDVFLSHWKVVKECHAETIAGNVENVALSLKTQQSDEQLEITDRYPLEGIVMA